MSKIEIINQIIELNNTVSPSTLQTHADTNDYITDVTNGYQTRSIDGTGDPNDPITKAINDLDDIDSIKKFLDEVMGEEGSKDHPEYDVTKWSSKQLMALQQKITDCLKSGKDKDAIGTLMSQVQGFQGVFNSYTTKELSGPQALEKSEQGVISTDPGKLQVILDLANSVMSVIGLYANLPKS